MRGEKVHDRKITITTFQCGEKDIIVEGELIDSKPHTTYNYDRTKFLPGTIHHMIVRILIDRQSLNIKDVEVEMPGTPHENCVETINSLERVKGIKIVQGFTLKIKDMFAQGQGCAHLAELLLAMAPAAVQGHYTLTTIKPMSQEFLSLLPTFLADTCWVWRKEGPALRKLKG